MGERMEESPLEYKKVNHSFLQSTRKKTKETDYSLLSRQGKKAKSAIKKRPKHSKENHFLKMHIKKNMAERRVMKSRDINALVRQSIKKLKKKKQTENMKRQEQIEREKQCKEFLGYRNKAIREMNAKSWSWSRLTQDSIYNKYARPNSKIIGQKKNLAKQVVKEEDRKTTLGLKFIELCRKIAAYSRKKTSKSEYTKKHMVKKERKKNVEKTKKNMTRLQTDTNKLFKGSNKKSTPERLTHKKKKHNSESFIRDSMIDSNTNVEYSNIVPSKIIQTINAITIQNYYREYVKRKKQHTIINVKQSEMINIAIQSEDNIKPETRTVETQTVPEMRLLIGSEKHLKDTLVQNDSKNSLFDRNPFQEFTQRKIRELVNTDKLAKLISMREKVMKHKEMTEMKYIKKMFKSKEFSPRTYQRKCRDLEKWVTKEQEEIKETKRTVNETWKRTAQIIQDAQTDSMNLRRVLETHPLSYNSEANSIFSVMLDSSRSLESINDKLDKHTLIDFNHRILWKRERSVDNLSDVVQDEELLLLTSSKGNQPIFIQDDNTPEVNETPLVHKLDSDRECTKDKTTPLSNQELIQPVKEDICIKLIDKINIDDKAEEITNEICKNIIVEALSSLFPERLVVPEITSKECKDLRGIGKDRGIRSRMIQSLAYDPRRGIPLDPMSIGRYLDSIFSLMITRYNTNFIREVNSSISKSNLEILNTLRGKERLKAKLPHEIQPIIPLSIYSDIERTRVSSFKDSKVNLRECEQIHNKAIFDSVNEALNLIRPYGITGEPLPWSLQQRILFKSITDPNIITRNIKNMVLDWISFQVGAVPKPNFLINGRFNEEYFGEVRERHLINMLAQEVLVGYKCRA